MGNHHFEWENSTISTGPFSIAFCIFTGGYPPNSTAIWGLWFQVDITILLGNVCNIYEIDDKFWNTALSSWLDYTHICVCIFIYIHMFVCVCMYKICMYVCIYLYSCTYVHIIKHAKGLLSGFKFVIFGCCMVFRLCMYIRGYTYIQGCTYIPTYIYTYMHIYLHTYIHIYI